MVLTEAETLKLRAECNRVKETCDVDEKQAKELEKKMTELAEKSKVVDRLVAAMLKLANNSIVKEEVVFSSQSMVSDDKENNK
ncbi:unnamed protein product [Arabis nemorensis]|uniref:Uncharacterized protein n=1 Tax=Arabis nemorensis TaxID=586526 RepID=A0A565C3C8_9BRAS|nr:unnamed protein product [Arabis nemorensis]